MTSLDISYQFVTAANSRLLDSVDSDVFDHEVRAEYLATFLGNPANMLVVAVNEGRVVGMASGITYAHPDKPLQLFVNEVGVAGRFQRRGIATQLMRTLFERARETGCREGWVATEVGNEPARALYRSLGAREDAEHAVVYVHSLR